MVNALKALKTMKRMCFKGIYFRRIIMTETILGLTVLNTVLILYMYRVIKNHHFYYGHPEED